jgi:ABC-type amino acid transport substrate-binding protein
MARLLAMVLAILAACASIVCAAEILITGNEAKIPKIYLKDNMPTGILIDIARYIDKRMDGYTFTFELYPWARAYALAEHGEAGIIGLSMTTERLAIFDYSDPIYYDEVIVVVRKGKEFPFETLTDLRGKTVGIGRSGTFGDEFDNAKKSGLFLVEEDSGDVSRLEKLLAGRIDCALISPGLFSLHQTIASDANLTRAKDQFTALPRPFKRDPNYLGFAKSMHMRNFLDKFNAVLKQGLENGDIRKIIDSHHYQ